MAQNDLNQWMLIGRLMAAPEMRFIPSGQPVTSIIQAVNNVYGSGQEKKTTLTKYRLEVWGKQAEIMNQYAARGQRIYAEARPKADQEEGPQKGRPRIWQDKEGGARADYEGTILSFQLLDKPSGAASGAPAPEGQAPASEEEFYF